MAVRINDDGNVIGVVVAPSPPPRIDPRHDPAARIYPIEPGNYPLGVYRGDTYEWVFQVLGADGLPIDIYGWRFKAEIRSAVDGTLLAGLQRMASALPGTPDPYGPGSADEVRDELQNGWVRMRLTADQSRHITGKGIWDLEATTPDGWVKTIIRGEVVYMGDVTTGKVAY